MKDVALDGLRADIAATHLAALGLLRVLDRQLPDARLSWDRGRAVLRSRLDGAEGIARWLAGEYAPTPMVAPWQKGGCYRDSVKTPRSDQVPLERAALSAPPGSRLAAFGATFRALDEQVLPRFGTRLGGDSPDKALKAAVVQRCRAWLPDEALPFVDLAAQIPEADADLRFGPALGGTGGSDGNKAIDTRFMEALTVLGLAVDDPEAAGRSEELAFAYLTGRAGEALPQVMDGLLHASGSQDLDGVAGDVAFANNPWQTVLGLEGMLLLAGSVHTLGARGVAAFPWSVEASARQHDKEAVVDLYLPEWEGWLDGAAAAALYARGRLLAGQRPATDVTAVTQALRDVGPALSIRRFREFRVTKRRGGLPNLAYLGELAVPAARAVSAAPYEELGPLLRLARGHDPFTARQCDRIEREVRLARARPLEVLLAAGLILRRLETAGTSAGDRLERLPRLSGAWVNCLADSSAGRAALAVAVSLQQRLLAVDPDGRERARQRADALLRGGAPLVTRLLDAVPVLIGVPPPRLGANMADLVWWAWTPASDRQLDPLLAVLRRARLPTGTAFGGERAGGHARPLPLAAVGPVILAAQPPPGLLERGARPDPQPLVALRRAGLPAAYEAAVRRLHRWEAPVERLPDVPEPFDALMRGRLAAAFSAPIHPRERSRLWTVLTGDRTKEPR